jgi:hypothetical protein
MNKLSKYLLIGLLEQESKIVALYGGGFKPPTRGHFEVVKKTLEDNPEIDKFYIVVGSGLRNNISQDESTSIWEIYKKYLPGNIEIVKSQSPLSYIKKYLQDNPENTIYTVVGTREGDENDIKDFTQRKEFFEKYSNKVQVLNIITSGGVSGTAARKAAMESKEEFLKFLPEGLTEEEQDIIFGYVKSVIQEDIQKNNVSKIELPLLIKSITEYMVNQDMNIKPLPKVRFIKDDSKNAINFFGKTAYYDPNQRLIVLYTMNRHPKDVMRSFAHEMIHHMQNCEGRLENISTDNTNEDGALPEIEREAYEKGNMTFRNWEDSIKNPPLQLIEGRYDKISNIISSDVFRVWKQSFEMNKPHSIKKFYYESNEYDIEVTAKILFMPGNIPLFADGSMDDQGEHLELNFRIGINNLPESWEEISMNLKDIIRHEIEHATQTSHDINQRPGKFMEDDTLIRRLIRTKELPKSQYFKLEKEIDANLQGMYFRAKKEKRPFIDVIDNYLSRQDITPEEKEEIMDLWRTRSKALSLPKF